MSSSFCSWLNEIRNEDAPQHLRFYLFVSDVNQVKSGKEVSPRFPFVTSSD